MFKLFERSQSEKESPGTQGIGTSGTMTVRLYDREGNLKAIRGPVRNLIVQIGKSYILQQLGSGSAAANTKASCRWTGIGHSATAPAAGQTALVSQFARRLNKFTFVSGNNYYSCISTFTSFGSGTRKGTIYESGLFWASTGSVMLARQTFSAVTKLTADTLTVEWKVSVS